MKVKETTSPTQNFIFGILLKDFGLIELHIFSSLKPVDKKNATNVHPLLFFSSGVFGTCNTPAQRSYLDPSFDLTKPARVSVFSAGKSLSR